jgi:hypothetical protein
VAAIRRKAKLLRYLDEQLIDGGPSGNDLSRPGVAQKDQG